MKPHDPSRDGLYSLCRRQPLDALLNRNRLSSPHEDPHGHHPAGAAALREYEGSWPPPEPPEQPYDVTWGTPRTPSDLPIRGPATAPQDAGLDVLLLSMQLAEDRDGPSLADNGPAYDDAPLNSAMFDELMSESMPAGPASDATSHSGPTSAATDAIAAAIHEAATGGMGPDDTNGIMDAMPDESAFDESMNLFDAAMDRMDDPFMGPPMM
ncbi:hypothetical protein GF348_24350 [candidate division KSB3 bacterium]|nr:hypothetical protein [candidate division KSB3 bacterium]